MQESTGPLLLGFQLLWLSHPYIMDITDIIIPTTKAITIPIIVTVMLIVIDIIGDITDITTEAGKP